MKDKQRSNASKVFWFFFFVGIVFVELKLFRVVSWPWLLVTAPFWAPLAVAFAAVAFLFVLMAIAKALKWISSKL